MKSFHVAAFSGLCLMASTAFAQIDYVNPEVDVLVTRQQILDYTEPLGNTGISIRCMVINSAGNLVVTDRGGAQGEARLIEIDISGASPSMSTIVTEAELAAVLETSVDDDEFGDPLPPPRLNFSGMAHFAFEGTDYYYVSNFGQNPNNCATCEDEVIEVAVDGAGTATVRRVGSIDGINALSVYNGYLYFPIISDFSNQIDIDGVYRMNITTGDTEEVADVIMVSDLTGALVGTRGAGFAMIPGGQVAFFSEEFWGGSNDILGLDVTAKPFTLSIIEPKDSFAPNFTGIAGMASDSAGTLFMFDQFPTTPPRRFIVRESDGTLHFPDPNLIIGELGLTNPNQQFFPNDTMRAVREGENKVTLIAVLADGNAAVGNPRIISLTFTDPTFVEPDVLGDINGDGVINVADVTMLANLVTEGTPPPVAVGDVNDDGVVDELDVQALAELIVND